MMMEPIAIPYRNENVIDRWVNNLRMSSMMEKIFFRSKDEAEIIHASQEKEKP